MSSPFLRSFFLTYRWAFSIFVFLCLFLFNISLGSVEIPFPSLISILLGVDQGPEMWKGIVFDFRLTKAVTCILAGSALAVGGLLMQTFFRNPLAGPDVFGLSSGASLAVSVLYMGNSIGYAIPLYNNPWTLALAASLGCFVVFMVVLALSRHLGSQSSLLIAGLMIGAAVSSAVSILQSISRAEDQQAFLFWTFGNVGNLNWTEITILSIVVALGTALAWLSVKTLNTWLLGENYAQSLGLSLGRSRAVIITCTSLLTGGVTAFCGPIAFIGLAVPHLVRLTVNGSNHKTLVPYSFLAGASLLLFCDILSRLPSTHYLLPLNAVTALIGAPVVIWIVLRQKVA